jgi:hypothetical protein
MGSLGGIIGQGLADTQSQRSEYGESGESLDYEDNQSVTVYHEWCNIKVDVENIGSPFPTVFILGNSLASNIGSMPLGGYTNLSNTYSETFNSITYLDAGSTTATWNTSGSLTY